ncbi:D-glycerate dehydrogenase [Candidatus Nomurabacteria bacterium]|nr:D-glycerate dehydrogenase [Candidatus Nomurabacteria bacterium]
MFKQIYITREIPEAGLKLLKEKGIEFDMGTEVDPPSKKDIIKKLKKKPYDGIISFLTDPIDKDVFDACPTAKVFANFSVGFNNIDLEEAQKRNIEISNTPGTSSLAVAEHTVALMMALTTRLVEGDRYMRAGKYRGWSPNLLVGTDMNGKVIGLIGGGAIGTEVAKILHRGFGSSIIYSDICENKNLENETGAVKKEMEELIKTADIISLHCPLLPSTTHLINEKHLSAMKKTAFLVNTSRGPVVDEVALVKALKDKTICGAALDVFEFEPKLTKGLEKLDNVILTPHIASARDTARNMMAEIAAKNVISVLETGKAVNSVFHNNIC